MTDTFDAPSFYSLFWNEKGIKCKVNIPDTVLFRFGQLSAWWGTTKEGYVQRHSSQSTSIEAIRKQFVHFAKEDEANYSQFVAISRLGDGKPQLLRLTAFNQLCELLSDRLESGSQDNAPEIETPSMLQAFVQPYEDQRYITTYVNAGTSVTCHTFQRKFSKRYTPMSAASAAQPDTRDADIIAALTPQSEQHGGDPQGVVEPALKMHLRKTTSHIVNYIQRAHGLVLGALVVEYVRNLDGKVYLLSVLRTEWLSNAMGHGAGSAGAHALTTAPIDIDDFDVEGVMAAAVPPQQQQQQHVPRASQGTEEGHHVEDRELTQALSLREGLSPRQGQEAAMGNPQEQHDLQHPPSLPNPNAVLTLNGAGPHTQHAGLQVQVPPDEADEEHLVPGSNPATSPQGGGTNLGATGSWGSSSSPNLSMGDVSAWGDDARTSYLGSPASARDAAASRPRENGGAGAYKVRPMTAVPRPSTSHSHSTSQGAEQQHRSGAAAGAGVHAQPPVSPSAAPSHGQERSPLACFPGGPQRVTQTPHPVSNTWPSLQHDQHLRPSSAPGTKASASPRASPTAAAPSSQVPLSARSHPHRQSPIFPMTDPRHRASIPRPNSSPPPRISQRAMSARNRGTPPTVNPGGAPRGFLSTTHRSNHTSPVRPYSARGVSAIPLEFAPVPGGTLPPPVGTLSLRGDHVNGPQRGVPLLVSGMQKEVEMLRDQLVTQHELAEANAAKVRQLEHEKEITVGTFDTRSNELMHLLSCTRDDLSSTRAALEQTRLRAEAAEARGDELERQVRALTDTVQSERATTLSALKEYQEKEASSNTRVEQCEAEVLRLSNALKMEITAVNSLKRQLLEFSEIAENQKATLRDSQFEIGMIEVMDRIKHLFAGQTNPAGEQYAVQKTLNHYHANLRAVFLFYTQLEATFVHHWPPHLTFAQWMMFCKDSETSDIRLGGRTRGRQLNPMLQPSECEALFTQYAKPDPTAMHRPHEPVLQYEAFLAALVHAATKLRRPDVPYVSEAVREYLLTYLTRAHRVEAAGLKRGALRAALEGTRKLKGVSNLAGSELDLSIKAGGQGSRPMSGRSDKSGGLGGGMSCSDCGSGIGSANGGKGSKSRPLSGRPMWRNPAANNRPVSPGSPGVWHSSLSA